MGIANYKLDALNVLALMQIVNACPQEVFKRKMVAAEYVKNKELKTGK